SSALSTCRHTERHCSANDGHATVVASAADKRMLVLMKQCLCCSPTASGADEDRVRAGAAAGGDCCDGTNIRYDLITSHHCLLDNPTTGSSWCFSSSQMLQ